MKSFRPNTIRAKTLLSIAALLVTATLANAQEIAVDPTLPVYQRVEGLKGSITMIGSDTIAQVAATWADGFRKLYPDVQIQIQVTGSVNAIPAVTSGEATFGLLSRQPQQEEVQAFHAKYGYLPTVLTPAQEPIAIFVHKDNPISTISPAQLRSIFAANPGKGLSTIKTWGELGATGQWEKAPILAQGRSNTTGSQVYFQGLVLGGEAFRADMKSNENNLTLVQAIAADPRSIGFVGLDYAVPEVKPLAFVYQPGGTPVDIHTAGYPLVRPLEIIVNKNPTQNLPVIQEEFLKYVLSRSGQESVVRGGFTPIQSNAALSARAAVGLKTLQ